MAVMMAEKRAVLKGKMLGKCLAEKLVEPMEIY